MIDYNDLSDNLIINFEGFTFQMRDEGQVLIQLYGRDIGVVNNINEAISAMVASAMTRALTYEYLQRKEKND